MFRSPPIRSTVAVVTLAAVLGLGAVPAAGQDSDDGGQDAASIDQASEALAQAEETQERMDSSLSELTAEHDRLLADLDERDGRRERATQDLVRARNGARSLAVVAYITADAGAVMLDGGPDTDDVYRDALLRDGAGARVQAAAYYQDLRSQADAAVTTTLDRLDELEAEISALSASRNAAVDDVRAASTDLETARAEAEARREAERQAAADLAALPSPPPIGNPSGAVGPWTPIGTIPGGPSPQQWAQLRNCESSGNYQAVSAGGAYRGAYQFDLSTWRTVGGSGDPIAASAAEQDHRAQLLWQSRGHAPWPICGRFLR